MSRRKKIKLSKLERKILEDAIEILQEMPVWKQDELLSWIIPERPITEGALKMAYQSKSCSRESYLRLRKMLGFVR